jgi:hypothetical protein
VIEDYDHDRALMTYGGYCSYCHITRNGEKPGLRDALRGQVERMNDVSEQEELQREVSMSDEQEMATGGIEYFDPPKTHYFENALAGIDVEQVTAESLRKALDEAAEQAQTSTPVSETVRLRTNGTTESANKYSWLAGSEPVSNTLTKADIRKMVRKAVRKALHGESDGIVNAYEHRRVRQWDEDGTEWRGVLYRVQKAGDKAFQPGTTGRIVPRQKGPSGICWVCGEPGEDMATLVRGPGLPTVHMHSTEECVSGAYRKDKAK